MRILVVEDDPVLALAAASTLEAASHEVCDLAFNQWEAMEVAAQAKPDLAFVDINLRGHDEGIALARDLLVKLGVASVFVSGQTVAARANKDAALGLLRKPYEPDELVQVAALAQGLMAGRRPPPPPVPASMEIFSTVGL